MHWIVTDPPAFRAVVKGLQDPNQWQQMRDRLFSPWLEGVDNPEATHFLRDIMGSASGEMGKLGLSSITDVSGGRTTTVTNSYLLPEASAQISAVSCGTSMCSDTVPRTRR
jgi:hypothetical protein